MQIFASKTMDSRALLLAALRQTHGCTALPTIACTESGKPYFPDYPGLHFNLSHSGDLAFCALNDAPVGVDVELLLPRRAELPAYALTQEEFAQYQHLGADWTAFYTLWTKKEAWCKYTGEGLGSLLHVTPPEEGLIYRHYLHQDWCATVCGLTTPPELLQWLDAPT